MDISKLINVILIAATARAIGYSTQGGGRDFNIVEVDYRDTLEKPRFLSKNRTFTVQIGSDVTFPCQVEKHYEYYKMIFKFISSANRTDRIIYVGNDTVGHSPRIAKHGSNFHLKSVRKSDAGTYVCRFETTPVMKLLHNLDVQFPAEIRRKGLATQKVIRGSKVTLRCKASGNPFPSVTWDRKDSFLPSDADEKDTSLTLHNVDRNMEGTYVCSASNEIGPPVSANITIIVEYKPQVATKQIFSSRNGSVRVQLVCTIHGRPKPRLSWLRGDTLVSSERHIMSYDEHRYTLTIFNVTDSDFGNYFCRASNVHGTTAEKINVSGLPRKPRIISNSVGFDKQSYRVSWEVDSISPITQYRIRYRNSRVNDGSHSKQWVDRLFFPYENANDGIKYVMDHTISDLADVDDYDLTVRIENRYGWSPWSDIFTFYTKKDIVLGESKGSSSKLLTNKILLWFSSFFIITKSVFIFDSSLKRFCS